MPLSPTLVTVKLWIVSQDVARWKAQLADSDLLVTYHPEVLCPIMCIELGRIWQRLYLFC